MTNAYRVWILQKTFFLYINVHNYKYIHIVTYRRVVQNSKLWTVSSEWPSFMDIGRVSGRWPDVPLSPQPGQEPLSEDVWRKVLPVQQLRDQLVRGQRHMFVTWWDVGPDPDGANPAIPDGFPEKSWLEQEWSLDGCPWPRCWRSLEMGRR